MQFVKLQIFHRFEFAFTTCHTPVQNTGLPKVTRSIFYHLNYLKSKSMINIIGLLIPPVLFLLLILYIRIIAKTVTVKLLLKAFIWGCVVTLPVILADQLAHQLHIDGARSIRRMIVFSFVAIAFVSEVSKFIPLRFSLIRKIAIAGPLQGIPVSMAVSLGLATVYAIYYIYFSDRSGADHIFLFSIGPMNAILGLILGFFTGMGKHRNNLFIDSMTGLGATIFFHGIYRFTLLTGDITIFGLFALGTLFVSGILIYKSRHLDSEL